MTTITLPNQPTVVDISWLDRPLWKRITPAVVILIAIMLLSTALHFTNIGAIGDSNSYYTAAVESMTQSWHNFFFVAAEPGASVTVDKPPLGLWIEAVFAFVLGVNGFSTSLPNILAGIFGVPILYSLVKKYLGSLAGLVAALVFTITPTVLGTDRNNTMDGMLVFSLLLAAWAFVKATETGRLRWLLLGGVIVGLGFNIKMLQAFLPLPAFYALYFFGAKDRWWRKLLSLGAATLLLLAVSLAWAVAVDLTPADQRPYVGSSADNTVMELIVGHNGLNRLFGGMRRGQAPAPQPGDGLDGFAQNQSPDNPRPPREAIEACNGLTHGASCTVKLADGTKVPGTCALVQGLLSCEPENRQLIQQTSQAPGQDPQRGAGSMFSGEVGTPSAIRFIIPPLAKEMSWLLPFALVSLLVPIFTVRLSWPLQAAHKSLVLWGGWLVTCLVFFSVAEFFHDYYMIMLAPALGAVTGGGVQVLWQRRERVWSVWLLALMAIPTLVLQWWLVVQFGQSAWWLWLAAVLMGAGLVGLALCQRSFHVVPPTAAFTALLAAILIVPMAWSVLTVAEASPDVNLPGAYSGEQAGMPGAFDGPQAAAPAAPGDDARPSSAGPAVGNHQRVDTSLLAYLQANTQDVDYLVAVPNASTGAPFVLATRRPVLYMGGFSGGDPVVGAADLARMVASGKLRYVLFTGDRNPQAEIANWLQTSCTVVPGFSTGQIASAQGNALPGQGNPAQNGPNQGGGRTLYQCGGSLVPYTANRAAPGNNAPAAAAANSQSLPPREALEACINLAIGRPCSVSLPIGATIDGKCRNVQGRMACVPERDSSSP